MSRFRTMLIASALTAVVLGNGGCFLVLFAGEDETGSPPAATESVDEEEEE